MDENQTETLKEAEDRIIFDLKLITKRAQQITTVAVFLSMCIAMLSFVYGLFFTPPIKALQEHNKIQDKRLDTIYEKQAKQDEIYHDIRKDQAVTNEKMSQIIEGLAAIREDMKSQQRH